VAPRRAFDLRRPSTLLLAVSLVMGAISHGYHLFQYPLHITDEGIYVQQAWSVLRQGALSPYTYFYDHAPAGWLTMAAWANVLPGQFQAFGNEIDTIRVLMLLAHIASTGFLFEIIRRFSGSASGAFMGCFLFNLSPLAIYYQRQVLLDNLMVFWLLLATFLLTRKSDRLVPAMAAGLAFGIAMITKENAVFFAPAIGYLVYRRASGRRNRRFLTAFWWFAAVIPVTWYFLFAQLKNELLPSNFNFDLASEQTEHVSLLYTMWWQLNRVGPTGRSLFYELLDRTWLPRDPVLPIVGLVATFLVLWLWWRDRDRRPGYLVAALMTLGYGFYMARGSVILDFYIVPLVMAFAMNAGVLYGTLMRSMSRSFRVGLTSIIVIFALVVPGGYFVVRNTEGRLKPHDLYELSVTPLQQAQYEWVRANIPPNARIIIDDEMWTALHDRKPYYKYAHSHFKAATDPDVRGKVFRGKSENIDYVVMSNKMRAAMERNNTGGAEDYILDAIDNQGELVWKLDRGDIHLAVYEIQ
jgi:4-amino-4-deoxy-L-arabinose transferase-like glycosyltransferase